MSRLNPVIATGLAVSLLAACTHTAEQAANTPLESPQAANTPDTKQVAEADEAIVLTGSRIQLRDVQANSPIAGYAPAPPPPSAPGVTVNRALLAQSSRAALERSLNRLPQFRPADVPRPYYQDQGRDKFTTVAQNPFKVVKEEPVSTFSIDVDTASYSFVRAALNGNSLPQPAAVRAEEMINYFPYDYASPKSAQQPFTSNVAVFPSPWTAGRKLVRIGIKGYAVQRETRPRANLVFLIDTSGSMNEPNKLPLVKQSLSMLLDQLDGDDSVAIVTYAGYAGTALAPTRPRPRPRWAARPAAPWARLRFRGP